MYFPCNATINLIAIQLHVSVHLYDQHQSAKEKLRKKNKYAQMAYSSLFVRYHTLQKFSWFLLCRVLALWTLVKSSVLKTIILKTYISVNTGLFISP